jgi:hypothetical protein
VKKRKNINPGEEESPLKKAKSATAGRESGNSNADPSSSSLYKTPDSQVQQNLYNM